MHGAEAVEGGCSGLFAQTTVPALLTAVAGPASGLRTQRSKHEHAATARTCALGAAGRVAVGGKLRARAQLCCTSLQVAAATVEVNHKRHTPVRSIAGIRQLGRGLPTQLAELGIAAQAAGLVLPPDVALVGHHVAALRSCGQGVVD